MPPWHLISLGLVMALMIFLQMNTSLMSVINSFRALMLSNVTVVVNYITVSSYVFTILISPTDSLDFYIPVTLLFIQTILNTIFLAAHIFVISKDPEFKGWASRHPLVNHCLLLLSTLLSFQTYRLSYSHFMGMVRLFVKLEDYKGLFKRFNWLSLLQMVLVHGSMVVFSFFRLSRISHDSASCTFMVEALILSLLMVALLSYEVLNAKDIITILELPKFLMKERLRSHATLNQIEENREDKELSLSTNIDLNISPRELINKDNFSTQEKEKDDPGNLKSDIPLSMLDHDSIMRIDSIQAVLREISQSEKHKSNSGSEDNKGLESISSIRKAGTEELKDNEESDNPTSKKASSYGQLKSSGARNKRSSERLRKLLRSKNFSKEESEKPKRVKRVESPRNAKVKTKAKAERREDSSSRLRRSISKNEDEKEEAANDTSEAIIANDLD
eukprot:TRINITY_DN3728_c0_g3_i1.p1 TRINITY_DN3728_c0_g3~~TRINITY_DN3728_c0_g3_i1.p1  ORF type:complete len:446 (-),score=84.34 TRINITY_DN3728_c0_g3_i1:118-1455(-)